MFRQLGYSLMFVIPIDTRIDQLLYVHTRV